MPISRYAMNYGLFLGAYWTIVFFVRIVLQRVSSLSIVYVFLLIFSLVVVYRMGKSFLLLREAEEIPTSKLQFILFGALLFFYGGLIDAIVQYIYYQYINPQYLSQQFALGKVALQTLMDSPQLKEVYENVETPSAIRFVMQMVWNSLFSGTLLFSIYSLFMVKKDRSK